MTAREHESVHFRSINALQAEQARSFVEQAGEILAKPSPFIKA